MSRAIGRPPVVDRLVFFWGGPWDGVRLEARCHPPARLVVRTVPPPPTCGNGQPWRLAELIAEADGGTHLYRRVWRGSDADYQYVGQLSPKALR